MAAAALSLAIAGPLVADPTDANMSLKKIAQPEPVAVGNPITYTLTVKCHGPADAANVVVTDLLPVGTTFVSAGGTDWTCSHLAGTVTCDYGPEPYPNGITSVITIVVTAPASPTAPNSQLVNYAVVATTTNDNSTANNDDNASTTVVNPGFTVTPTTALVTTEAGGTDTFTVVLNAPPSPLNDVAVSSVSDDSTEGTAAPVTLTFTDGNWNVAQTVTVTGVDDILTDGDIPYTILNTFTTTDVAYGALDPDTAVDDVGVTNLDDASEGTFYTLPPCRVLDTRLGGGPFSDTETRTYPIAAEFSDCGLVSTTARAVSLNITVAEATGSGEFNLYAVGVTPLGSTILPFRTGNNRANNAVVALSALGELIAEASLPGGGTAQLIIDINGYFE